MTGARARGDCGSARRWRCTGAGCSASAGRPGPAWPARPITFIVPFAAGGGTDAFARPLAQQLDGQLGQRVIIENRPGAGGTAGAAAAAKAEPDGYTFFVGAAHHAIAPAIYPEARLRHREGLHPDRADLRGRRTSSSSIRTRCRPRRWPNSSPSPRPIRTADLRPCRHRHDASSRGRAVQAADRHEDPAGALSRRWSADAGSRRRPGRHGLRRARLVGAPDRGRHHPRARRRGAEARRRPSRTCRPPRRPASTTTRSRPGTRSSRRRARRRRSSSA